MPQPAPITLRRLPAATHRIEQARAFLSPCLALTKPRVTLLVTLTALAACYVGEQGAVGWERLTFLTVGTALLASGTAALNQLWEWRSDALMRRTKLRPLPTGQLRPPAALAVGLALMGLGLVALAWQVNWLSAGLGAATSALYLLVYTPLKYHSPLSTVIGALPGGGPILMGWAAAQNRLDAAAWALFGIQFLWQFPHFLAIAELCREDYQKAGIRMLPVLNAGGEESGRQTVLYCLALLPVSLLPAVMGIAGEIYLVAALVLGVGLLWVGIRSARAKTHLAARHVLRASVLYLPLLFIIMMLNKR
ncbi:MAG: heme o synthase [Terriglobales bacterium]